MHTTIVKAWYRVARLACWPLSVHPRTHGSDDAKEGELKADRDCEDDLVGSWFPGKHLRALWSAKHQRSVQACQYA